MARDESFTEKGFDLNLFSPRSDLLAVEQAVEDAHGALEPRRVLANAGGCGGEHSAPLSHDEHEARCGSGGFDSSELTAHVVLAV